MPLGFLLANQSCLHWIIKCAIESRGWYSFSSFGLRMLFHVKVLCLRLMSPLLCCNNVITATDVTATEKTFCDSGLIHLCCCHGASSGASVGFAFRWPSWCSKWCNSDRNSSGAVAINTTNDPSRCRSLTFCPVWFVLLAHPYMSLTWTTGLACCDLCIRALENDMFWFLESHERSLLGILWHALAIDRQLMDLTRFDILKTPRLGVKLRPAIEDVEDLQVKSLCTFK